LIAKRIWRKSLTPIVRFAQKHDKLIVLASGNYGATNDNQYLPDKSDVDDTIVWRKHTIIVGAIDANLKVAHFSDKGKVVDIYAPGVDIYVPSGFTHGEIVAYLANQITHFGTIYGEQIPDESSITNWELRSGTSYAAPFVTGAIQFIRAFIKNEYDKAPFVKELIVSNAKLTHEGYPVLNFELIIDDMKKRGLL
jgi:subtilisin family serine protease